MESVELNKLIQYMMHTRVSPGALIDLLHSGP